MQRVIIIGAGPAGLSFGCSVAALGLDVTIIEKQPQAALSAPAYDGREIAITHLSKQILEEMGAWEHLPKGAVSLVKEAKIIDGDAPYALHFDHQEVGEETLGYIISNHQIRTALYAKAETYDNITLLCEQSVERINTDSAGASVYLKDGRNLHASLLVAADSRFSTSRRNMGISTKMHDFGKTAIVCTATHALSHNNTAYECFLYGGTLAVLPLSGDESSIVITLATQRAEAVLKQSPEEFSAEITQQFEGRFGKMTLSSELFSYPLVATYADSFIANRFAVIGDAAVGMHPVTAHGFNLGLKGQHILAEQIGKALHCGGDIGAQAGLRIYNRKHRIATKPLYLGTNSIVSIYTDERPLHKLLRKAMLRLGNHVAPAKKAIMNQLTETKHVA
jgi:ubiquinone biosynthesis UbiH/UbiF/VisC/COQ6 family hydroxylase